MTLQHIKMTVSGVWVMTMLAIAIAFNLTVAGGALLAALAFLPTLALLLLWNDPSQTMSESINEARRR